ETTAGADGEVHAGEGWTDTVVTPARGVRAVDGLLTGWHEPDASHLDMLEAIGGHDLLERSYPAAAERGHRWHAFGDLPLIPPSPGLAGVPAGVQICRHPPMGWG